MEQIVNKVAAYKTESFLDICGTFESKSRGQEKIA